MRLLWFLIFTFFSFKGSFGLDTFKVIPVKTQIQVQVSGQVESGKQCAITSKTEGYFHSFVSVGDRVKIGQVIGSFKNEFLDSNIQSTVKRIEITQTEIQNLTKKLENYENLYNLGLASKNDILDIKNSISLKKSELETLKAQLKTYSIQKSNFKLFSNCEGYILNIVPEGQYVTVGTPIATVYNQNSNFLYLYVPVEYLNLIKSKKVLSAKLNDDLITLNVKEIVPVSEGNLVKVKTYSEKVIDLPLNYRQSITLYIDGLSGFKIPKKSLVLEDKGFFVFKVSNGKELKEKVNVIKDEGDFVIVSGNLKDGDEVKVK
ncbi:MAG TPA: efflux RND transporter periplasmic adaptor subunit [Sulfurihydrogenibium azorense]|uniref:Efflux RND transporter periplasmic adaptor subunit n=1 Tax=Sulfurihydrogenibium azorense TaxID=309806 RepID=A0A832DQA8_9AQUI|nr:efflux RND transporter periplasmic adaptor subunit [Sulfurihydrogenibium azorense]